MTHRRSALSALPLILATLLLAGCASADKNQPAAAASATTTSSSTQATSGMNMDMGGSTVAAELPAKINGVAPVASQLLATTDWQGMEIEARTMTPAPYVMVSDTGNVIKETTVKPPQGTSFHLMIMLKDQHTQEPVPYASVWASVFNSAGKLVWQGSQLPMISAYMGPHYGSNVSLPGPGRYTLKLLITPPVGARHIEYAHVWLSTHTVTEHFTWNPKS
jgi:outer membrane murein-binding lipoprotein Lpp